MNKKICKIIIAVMIILAFIVGIMYFIDLNKIKNPRRAQAQKHFRKGAASAVA